MGVGLFIHEQFMEEDGDGINLIIISDQRQKLEDKMNELSKTLIPAKVGDKGYKFFKVSELRELWERAKKLTKYKA